MHRCDFGVLGCLVSSILVGRRDSVRSTAGCTVAESGNGRSELSLESSELSGWALFSTWILALEQFPLSLHDGIFAKWLPAAQGPLKAPSNTGF
jgi:hypothetical protein